MERYILDQWKIIEEGFDPAYNKASESIFSLGNGRMGQRANFEEDFSGPSFQGNYIAGVYYPDKTRVGWWKNGYPEYFAKVINSANWIGIKVVVNGENLDLAKCKALDFHRELNMREGYLQRKFKAVLANGNRIEVEALRFLSMTRDELGLIRYTVKALNFDGAVQIIPYIDGDVKNEDSNYDEKFWTPVFSEISERSALISMETKKTRFEVCTGMSCKFFRNG